MKIKFKGILMGVIVLKVEWGLEGLYKGLLGMNLGFSVLII